MDTFLDDFAVGFPLGDEFPVGVEVKSRDRCGDLFRCFRLKKVVPCLMEMLWIAICLVSFLLFRLLSNRYQPTVGYSWWCAAWAGIRTFPIAFLFGPTLWIVGWFPFPAPAGLILIHCALDPEFHFNSNEPIRKNLGLAMIGLTGFWLVS